MASVTRRGKNGRAGRGTVEGHIFDAVERLLAAGESYTAIGVQRIADEAGIARSSFYLNFADKVDLLMRLSEAATRDLFASAKAWVRGDQGRTLESLADAMTLVVAEYRAHAPTLAAVAEVAAYDEETAGHWRALVEDLVAVWSASLRADQEAGRAPADLDVERTVRFIVQGGESMVARHVAENDPADDPALGAVLARVAWAAFYARREDLP